MVQCTYFIFALLGKKNHHVLNGIPHTFQEHPRKSKRIKWHYFTQLEYIYMNIQYKMCRNIKYLLHDYLILYSFHMLVHLYNTA